MYADPIEYDFSWRILTGSMSPTLEVNDTVYIKNVTGLSEVYASPVNGDIIMFIWYYGEIPVVHRAVEKYQENGTWYFVARGDHNPAPDSPRSEDQVIGKVVAVQRVLQVESYNVSVFSNSAFIDFHFNSTDNTLEFNVTMPLTQSSPQSLVNVTVPNEIVTGELNVLVDGSSVDFTHLTNSTHHFVSFELERSSYISELVLPEFSSFLILPLFFTATLLAVIVYRRKTKVSGVIQDE